MRRRRPLGPTTPRAVFVSCVERCLLLGCLLQAPLYGRPATAHLLSRRGLVNDAALSSLCPNVPGYTLLENLESLSHDIGRYSLTAPNMAAYATACNRTRGCIAFTSQGLLKSGLQPVDQWRQFANIDDPPGCMGMYVQSDKVPPGLPLVNAVPLVYGNEVRSMVKVGASCPTRIEGFYFLPAFDSMPFKEERPDTIIGFGATNNDEAFKDLAKACLRRDECVSWDHHNLLFTAFPSTVVSFSSYHEFLAMGPCTGLYVRASKYTPPGCEAVPGYAFYPGWALPSDPRLVPATRTWRNKASAMQALAAECRSGGPACSAFTTGGLLQQGPLLPYSAWLAPFEEDPLYWITTSPGRLNLSCEGVYVKLPDAPQPTPPPVPRRNVTWTALRPLSFQAPEATQVEVLRFEVPADWDPDWNDVVMRVHGEFQRTVSPFGDPVNTEEISLQWSAPYVKPHYAVAVAAPRRYHGWVPPAMYSNDGPIPYEGSQLFVQMEWMPGQVVEVVLKVDQDSFWHDLKVEVEAVYFAKEWESNDTLAVPPRAAAYPDNTGGTLGPTAAESSDDDGDSSDDDDDDDDDDKEKDSTVLALGLGLGLGLAAVALATAAAAVVLVHRRSRGAPGTRGLLSKAALDSSCGAAGQGGVNEADSSLSAPVSDSISGSSCDSTGPSPTPLQLRSTPNLLHSKPHSKPNTAPASAPVVVESGGISVISVRNPCSAVASEPHGSKAGGGPDSVSGGALCGVEKSASLGFGNGPKREIERLASALKQADKLVIGAPLGRGAFGYVYQGEWKGLAVACKTMTFQGQWDPAGGPDAPHQNKAMAQAVQEAAVAVTCVHPNVVQTYTYEVVPLGPLVQSGAAPAAGTMTIEEEHSGWKLYLVQELCAMNLADAVWRGLLHYGQKGTGVYLPREGLIVHLLAGTARGLAYVHSRGILHGDVKPDNVLLALSPQGSSFPYIAKVSDFGLCTLLREPDQTHVSDHRCGTPFYTAPEVPREGRISRASDVWSFGVMMWEIYTAIKPFTVLGVEGGASTHGLNPQFVKVLKRDTGMFAALVRRCLSMDQGARPSFEEVACYLDAMMLVLGKMQATRLITKMQTEGLQGAPEVMDADNAPHVLLGEVGARPMEVNAPGAPVGAEAGSPPPGLMLSSLGHGDWAPRSTGRPASTGQSAWVNAGC